MYGIYARHVYVCIYARVVEFILVMHVNIRMAEIPIYMCVFVHVEEIPICMCVCV